MVLPSKKILPILLACIIAVGSIGAALYYAQKEQGPQKPIAVLAGGGAAELLDTDTDGDGLKDWEESLWGTDIEVSDTDGDGTTDGQEVKSNRNPVVKGSNDTLEANKVPETIVQNTKSDEPENLSLTDRAARELFATYMELKQKGQTITPEIQAELAERLIINSQDMSLGGVQYSALDVKISSNSSDDALRTYANKAGAILTKYAFKPENAELPVIERAVQNKDRNELAKLAIIEKAYKNMLREFLALQAPAAVQVYHVQLVNDLSALIAIVQGMQKLFDDPILALGALQNYATVAENMAINLSQVATYYESKGIEFTTKESGYRFLYAE